MQLQNVQSNVDFNSEGTKPWGYESPFYKMTIAVINRKNIQMENEPISHYKLQQCSNIQHISCWFGC